jgi:geranylgeranyl diphosphate synthase type I
VTDVARRVGRRLEQVLGDEVQRWTAVSLDLAPPLDALRSILLGGGKRLRPALCYWACAGAGGDIDDRTIIDAGAALELLHTAACVHDDVIDQSDRRHGTETLHVQFARRHQAQSWRGAPEPFGAGVAVLLGDLALVCAGRLLNGAPDDAVAVFDEMRLEVNVGQYLDLLGAAKGVSDAEAASRARQICRYKTAKYTVERPLHLGVALAGPGCLSELAAPLSAFGLPLGEAFQLRDDLLGVFGDPAVTGKPIGDDLREGKPTLLAALAHAEATGAGAHLLADRFGAADLTQAEAMQLRAVIDQSGARRQVETAIAELVTEAMQALDRLAVRPWPADAIAALRDIAEFVTGRDH